MGNAVAIAVEAQYRSFDIAEWTRHRSASGMSHEVWPSVPGALDVIQLVFGVLFCVEIAMKIIGLRLEFVNDPWNWLDLFIVIVWLVSMISFSDIISDAPMIRVARLVRLLRFVKIVKIMKAHHGHSLYLMTIAVKQSVSVLMWTCILLGTVHMLFALVLNQCLYSFYFVKDFVSDTSVFRGQAEVYEYFGSFTRSLLTMFEITLANW